MTEDPEPTRPIDMSKLLNDAPEDPAPERADVVEGEPGWDAAAAPADPPE